MNHNILCCVKWVNQSPSLSSLPLAPFMPVSAYRLPRSFIKQPFLSCFLSLSLCLHFNMKPTVNHLKPNSYKSAYKFYKRFPDTMGTVCVRVCASKEMLLATDYSCMHNFAVSLLVEKNRKGYKQTECEPQRIHQQIA